MILYREYAPCPALRPFLACLWSCSLPAMAAPAGHRVLPDNGLDILWQDAAPGGFVVGMMSAAVTVHTDAALQTVAVRFKPGRAAAFFGLPLHELLDSHAALPDLWERGATERLAQALWERPLATRARLDLLERHLLQQLRQGRRGAEARGDRGAALALAAVAALEHGGAAPRIEALADSLGVSRQHLAQLFRQRVGLPAKTFARVCRFQRAKLAIRQRGAGGGDNAAAAGRIDWAALALEHGYFDQPHLIHDFQDLSGRSPASFIAV